MLIADFLFRPTLEQRAFANQIFFAIVLATGAITGSAVSVAVGSALVWPFLWFGRYSEHRPVPKPVRAVALAFLAFFLVEAFGCIAQGGEDAFSELIENLPFLGILPMWWVLAAQPRHALSMVTKTAAASAMLALLAASYFVLFIGQSRIELSAGNASILSLVSAILLMFNLIGAATTRHRLYRLANIAGAFAAVLLVFLSGTRTMWLAVLVVPILIAVLLAPPIRLASWKAVAAMAAALTLATMLFYQPVLDRIKLVESEMAALEKGDTTTSIGQRLVIWKAAEELIIANPWTGVGPGNYRQVLLDKTRAISNQPVAYSHAHNMFINATVRNGLPGLIAMASLFVVPFLVGLKALRRGGAHLRPYWATLVGLQATYLIAGSLNLAIGHDILDAVFITGTVFALYGLLADGEAGNVSEVSR